MRHVKLAVTQPVLPRNEPPPNITAVNETDTNADTCCFGTNFVILNHGTGRTADVYPYDKAYKSITNVPIVAGATAYDDLLTKTTYILVFNEGLYYGTSLDHSTINPNQIRANGIPYWDNPYNYDNGLRITPTEFLDISLVVNGTKLKFTTRTPTTDELTKCLHIQMTIPIPWEPEDVQLGQFDRTTRALFCIEPEHGDYYEYSDPNSDEAMLHKISPDLVDLKERIIATIRTTRTIPQTSTETPDDDIPTRRSFVSGDQNRKVTAEVLAERFCIGTERAKATMQATTQRGVRSALLPISQRYKADWMYN